MTALTGVTPRPAQLKAAYSETFDAAIDAAAGKDGRISRSEAARVGLRADAGQLVSDNLVGFLEATGQKSVSAAKFKRVVADYVEREAGKAAGPNQRLSLLEIRSLPKDLQADALHLRGKDSLAPMAPRVGFNENDLYEFMQSWTPTHVVDQGSVSHDGTRVQATGLADLGELNGARDRGIENAWRIVLQHRGFGDEPVELSRNGALEFGPIVDDVSGRLGLMVHWKDIDDGSHAWFFAKDDAGQWQQQRSVHLG